jgi:aminobenzoyl-glutamate utilization protein B
MRNEDEIWRLVDTKREDYQALADRVWGMPELCYARPARSRNTGGCWSARASRHHQRRGHPDRRDGRGGEDGPVIAILGEYDALPGLSQEAGVTEPRPVPGESSGHGCGHNLLGAGAMLAAAAVKDWLAANGIKGRVRYYGCPAEEGGAAKGFMVREGAFDDVDIAISWHPACFAGVWSNDQPATSTLRPHRYSLLILPGSS